MEGIWSPPPSRLYMQGCNGDQSAPDTRASHGPCSPVPKHPPPASPLTPKFPGIKVAVDRGRKQVGKLCACACVCASGCVHVSAAAGQFALLFCPFLPTPKLASPQMSPPLSHIRKHPVSYAGTHTHTHNARARSIITNVEEMTLL